jgi:hypothetical protein
MTIKNERFITLGLNEKDIDYLNDMIGITEEYNKNHNIDSDFNRFVDTLKTAIKL